jgi:hypothetical protein
MASDESDDAAALSLLSLLLLSLLLLLLSLLSLDEAALSPPLDPASSLSDPQADATIASAARMTMNRFNMKRFPSVWFRGGSTHPAERPQSTRNGSPS